MALTDVAIRNSKPGSKAIKLTETPAQALDKAQEYFEEWFPTANQFHGSALHSMSQDWLKKAAFDMHQATERLYHCVLLVCTFYTPLCRARHNGVYAERHTMPRGHKMPQISAGLGVFGSA
ncbi:hypothetical protein [Novosphingobium aquae]|uniref:Uncharacterized protein n=1 Tax=Novosphingobium aquae TaxID=3133435 RepID=A0ABU8SC17_9SPHN